MTRRDLRLQRAQQAIDSIGLGFDVTQDIRFDNFKSGPRLIKIDEQDCGVLNIPGGGGVSIPNVPKSIKCRAGESLRIQSEVLTHDQMSDHFNEGMRLTSGIGSGHFCASFGLSGNSVGDAAASLLFAYDGWFIRRYAVELNRYGGNPSSHVEEAVPESYDPEALARFIERFGTHVVIGVSMGGKDVIYVRQDDPSCNPVSLMMFLKDKASMRFTDSTENNNNNNNHHCQPSKVLHNNKENIVVIHDRRGGSNEAMMHRHSEWLQTVDSEPDVISLYLLPLQSLLSPTPGCSILERALYSYLRYKPPIEDLSQFFAFLLPKRWAPEHGVGYHWKNQVMSGLKLGFLGPILYINTIPVDVGNRPVTGLRLHLDGAGSDRLAIHLQHLTSLPMGYQLSDDAIASPYFSCDPHTCSFHKRVKRWGFSYVCTAPVETTDSVSIVKGARLQVESNCLILRLCFSKVAGATLKKPPEWDKPSVIHHHHHSSSSNCMPGNGWKCIFPLNNNNTKKGRKNYHPKPGDVTIGSTASGSTASAPQPAPVNESMLQRFVDTTEMTRGPEDTPGYWVVSGARLSVQNGEINLHVKYSLLSFVH